jgi:ubiquinone/menaquinone biosynthesis C-methylase UbiE
MPDDALDATESVRRTWDSVSHSWERHRERVFSGFRPVSEWLVDQLDVGAGQTILELAAGPGETGFLAAKRLGPDGRLISTDLAPGMVDAARRGAERAGITNTECLVMDAQALDLPDDSVDGVLCRLGFMLMPDPARAFAEAHRVLRPGRRLAYAVIGAPDRNSWMGVAMMAFVSRGHLPTSGDPFGPGGPFSLAMADRNRELLGAAGFDDIQVQDLEGTMAFSDPDDYWTIQTALGGPIVEMAASLPADELAEIRAAVERAMEPFRTADGYALPSHLVAVTAAA